MQIKPACLASLLAMVIGVTCAFAEEGNFFDAAFNRLMELNLMSQGLVKKAGSGQAPATEFRIEARLYRELLRQLALENQDASKEEKIPQNLLFEMVRMSALLHAAADCKTGRVITCPADLMIQLKTQQALVSKALESVQPTSAATSR